MPDTSQATYRQLNRNRWGLPTPPLPTSLRCVKVWLPDDGNENYYISLLIGRLYTLQQQIWYERDDSHTAKAVAAIWKTAYDATMNDLSDSCDCNTNGQNNDSGGNVTGGSGSFDDFLELMKELDVKYRVNGELYEVVLDLVPCGCGGGESSNDSTGNSIANPTLAGSSPAGAYGTDITTICDYITSGIPWLVDQIDDMIGKVQTASWVIETFSNIDNADVLDYYQSIKDNADQIEGELLDPDFTDKLSDIIAKHFDDPVPRNINRLQLFNFVRKIPIVFEGAPMQSAFITWALGVNMQVYNNNVISWAGTGNYAECEAVEARVGRDLYDPSENAPVLEDEYVLESGGVTYTLRVFPIASAYNRTSLGGSAVPYDYIGTEVVGAGVVITDLVDLAGNATELRLTYNDANVVWWTAPNDMTAISQYHVAAWNNANVILAVREELQQRAVNRVGLSVDDTINTTKITPSSRADTFNVGAADIDTYSGTVAFAWIVSTDN